MSTIEQAAKRLEQLRKSGVGADAGHDAREALLEPSQRSAVLIPLAGSGALDSTLAADGQFGRTSPQGSHEGELNSETPGTWRTVAVPPSKVRVDVDLARLSTDGYITPHSPRSPLAEQFRVIKRPLLTNARGKGAAPVVNANRIMVTSSLPSEGKTFVAINLAMSLAMELDTHVLLVDADTSRPAVLDRLGLPPAKGLLDLLVDPLLSLDSVLMSTNVERLSLLPAGNPQGQATELLASEAMSELVARLASEDPRLIVLFDTPPLLATSEAPVLAAHMGQVILVVAADETQQATVQEALSTIENCPVVMTLLNRSTAAEAKHYYGYYGAYAS